MINVKVFVALLVVLFLLTLSHFFLKTPDGYSSENDQVSAAPWNQWQLSKELKEISGLAYLPGLLVTHTDEKGSVYIFDHVYGLAKEWIRLGSKPVKDDFEGIAFLDSDLYLLTSTGLLYQVQNALDLDVGSVVEPNVIDTHLLDECEFEGLATMKQDLLLLCKVNYREEDQEFLLIWSWSSETGLVDTWLRLPIIDILEKTKVEQLRASALDLFAGKVYVLAGRERLLIEIDDDRKASIFKLKKKRHQQAEGLAFVGDGSFYIADEGTGKKNKAVSSITLYQSLDDLKKL